MLGGLPFRALANTNPAFVLGAAAIGAQGYRHYQLASELSSLQNETSSLGIDHKDVINRQTLEEDMWIGMANPNLFDSASVLNASQASEIDRWKTAIAEAKATKNASNNNNNNVGTNTAPSATARSGIFLRSEPEFSLSNVVNAASGLAPIYSMQRPNDVGGTLIWTPRPDPLPPLPGFTPMPNHGIRLETPIHEPSLLDYVTWTPAAKPEDRFTLPGFEAHDFDEHDMSVLFNIKYL
jgi:hypothetical protein